MREAKERALRPMGTWLDQRCRLADAWGKDEIEAFVAVKENYEDLSRRIREWPLDVNSLRDFLQTVALPLIPVLAALAAHLSQ